MVNHHSNRKNVTKKRAAESIGSPFFITGVELENYSLFLFCAA